MSAAGNCPGCGAQLVFRVATSVVAVCPYCSSVVARGDAGLVDLGKTNEVLSTGSALAIGRKATFRGRAFEVAGRTQLRHQLGGTWDEWYLAFDDGRWAWLAEHQGRFALTLEADPAAAPRIASLEDAQPGKRVTSTKGTLVVSERGVAAVAAEEGELPWRAAPQERRAYVDLSAPGGFFATLDFGVVDDDDKPQGPLRFYWGREVSLEDLGLASAAVSEPKLRQAGGRAINCPKCNGTLELKSGDAQSVGCPYCGALLDVKENGELAFLFAQSPKNKPHIPLGNKAHIDAAFHRYAPAGLGIELDVEVVAFVVRSVKFDGFRYQFSETLLYDEKQGFFWLVESDGHWTFVKNVPAAALSKTMLGGDVRYQGMRFRAYQDSEPRVEQVTGELYWKVNAGEESTMRDFIRPPLMLSREVTEDEVNWTLGWYVDKSDVERVFGVTLDKPTGVGANQPSPYLDVLKRGFLPMVVAAALCLVVAAVIPVRKLADQWLALEASAASPTGRDPGHAFSLSPLQIRDHRNVVVDLHTPDPGWSYVEGSLFKSSTGALHKFDVALPDTKHQATRFSAMSSGDYALNLKVFRSNYTTAGNIHVTVAQGRPGTGWIPPLVLLLLGGYAVALSGHSKFEALRNESSTFQ